MVTIKNIIKWYTMTITIIYIKVKWKKLRIVYKKTIKT